MTLVELLKQAEERVVLLGVLPFAEELEKSARAVTDVLLATPDVRLSVLCESDSHCFHASLITDIRGSTNRMSYTKLITHRDRILGTKDNRGLLREVSDISTRDHLTERITIRQQNALMPFYGIVVDEKVYGAVIATRFPTLDDYFELPPDSPISKQILDYANFFVSGEGAQFLSSPQDELLQLYDRQNYPRGIYPRSCFYTTKFKRRSIWGFVFNRKGQILLHQRSLQTKDGRGLWDKSTGGHIDLREDAITSVKRELIEELFMEEAEFTSYIDARISDIVSFGEWNLDKRPESSYRDAFGMLDKEDWILFAATDRDKEGAPLVIDRVSQRRYHQGKKVVFRPTNFVSEVFLLIAPEGCIDTDDQMKERFAFAEQKGAAQAHRIIGIDELRDWIEDEAQSGRQAEVFTDDMIYVNNEYMGMLEQFAEFVCYIFGE